MRYARLDAHALAWQSIGLDACEIVALSSAVATECEEPLPSHEADVQRRLVNRGWLDAGGDVSDVGRAARSEIEADTNARCAPMFSAVSESERWHNSLCDLMAESEGDL